MVGRDQRWNPWRELRVRRHLYVSLIDTLRGDAFYWPCPEDGRGMIGLSRRLDQVERRCALAHELVHDERRGGCSWSAQPDSWAAVVARDERQVDEEVARRLVPIEELAELVETMCDLGGGVELHHIAEEFEVTARIAELALLELARSWGDVRRAG